MAKTFHADVLDAALNYVKNNGTTAVFCSAQPANYAGIAAVTLITKTGLTSSSFTGPADSSSNRVLTLSAMIGMIPSSAGTVAYLVVTDGSAKILAGTTVTSQAVATTESWSSNAVTFTANQPT